MGPAKFPPNLLPIPPSAQSYMPSQPNPFTGQPGFQSQHTHNIGPTPPSQHPANSSFGPPPGSFTGQFGFPPGGNIPPGFPPPGFFPGQIGFPSQHNHNISPTPSPGFSPSQNQNKVFHNIGPAPPSPGFQANLLLLNYGKDTKNEVITQCTQYQVPLYGNVHGKDGNTVEAFYRIPMDEEGRYASLAQLGNTENDGRSIIVVEAKRFSRDNKEDDNGRLLAHRILPGNRPNISRITLRYIDKRSYGRPLSVSDIDHDLQGNTYYLLPNGGAPDTWPYFYVNEQRECVFRNNETVDKYSDFSTIYMHYN
jgi:hypothetical protein